ncbi:hypothetical protein [Salinimicrobium xinjiangense]|uniref:hypothetical protein n=1 Tax=Salinimicrobium xinjiangense TaxID=438596 RepID=UPI00048F85D0|nr:hypothetical protein [Salinimicrobium xinjiangense]
MEKRRLGEEEMGRLGKEETSGLGENENFPQLFSAPFRAGQNEKRNFGEEETGGRGDLGKKGTWRKGEREGREIKAV